MIDADSAAKVFRRFSDGALSSLLKQEGFTRIGRSLTWNRGVTHLVHVVELQIARPRRSDRVEATANWGVAVIGLAQLMWGRPDPEYFNLGSVTISGRASNLSIEPQRVWWDFVTGGSAAGNDQTALRFTAQIRAIVRSLDRFKGPGDVYEALATWPNEPSLIFPPSEMRRLEMLAGVATLERRPDAAELLHRYEASLNRLPEQVRSTNTALPRLRHALGQTL